MEFSEARVRHSTDWVQNLGGLSCYLLSVGSFGVLTGKIPTLLLLGTKTLTVEVCGMHLNYSTVMRAGIEGEWLSGRIMKASECHGDNIGRH